MNFDRCWSEYQKYNIRDENKPTYSRFVKKDDSNEIVIRNNGSKNKEK